jgi:hypothetical protein
MFQKTPFLLFLLLVSLFLTSCFQVIEEISLKADGSGEAKITLNLSQSKSKVASILLMDSINGRKVPDEKAIRKFMNEAVAELKKNEGITNVKQSLDMTTYIASVSFSFKNVSAVNNLTANLLKKQKVKQGNVNRYFYDKAAGVFKREYVYSPETKAEYNKLKTEDKDVFKTATYTSIYRFETAVLSNSNKLAKLSPSGKAVMMNMPVMELINGKANISGTIQLSK